MPAKIKYTKEQIIEAALNVVREKGAGALSARTLAKKLGTSPQPIFSYFDNMEQVQTATVNAAKSFYAKYVQKGLQQTPAFKGVGMQYILFAKNEPKLFQMLFMSEKGAEDVHQLLPIMDDNYAIILRTLRDLYNLNEEESNRLYIHLGIYSHGIATLIARKVCNFSMDDVSKMLTEVFTSLLKEIKGDKVDD
ncbi:MAG: TetR/AcrR family transcriptional regulator [Acutalibacteraceae bacterium]